MHFYSFPSPALYPLKSTLFPYTTLFRSFFIAPIFSGIAENPLDNGNGLIYNKSSVFLLKYSTSNVSLLSNIERSEEHTSNSSHVASSYAVFCFKKKKNQNASDRINEQQR